MKNTGSIFSAGTRVTRILFLFSFCFLSLHSYAVNADRYAQEKTLTVEIQNKTVKEVLDYIEKNSEFIFFYYNKAIDTKRNVSLSVKDKPITVILNQLFEGTDVRYEIKDRQISLKKEETQQSSKDNKKRKKRTLTGWVLDEDTNEPLVGVSIMAQGENRGIVTGIDGSFSIEVYNDTKLQFSYIGYKKQLLQAGNQQVLNVKMQSDNALLNEVVVVGYGTQKKGTLTGSISSVKSEDLTIAPIATVSNSLAGRLPGLIATQSSGQPGANSAALNIRGFGNALVIVDGVEASLDNIDTNQIESVSILKDGAASIYGARAGNGVILVTTKRGINQKPTITVNSTFTWQGATNMLKPANAGQRAEMEREKHLQSGKPEADAPFTEEAVRKYYEGTDPLFPNTDWYKVIMRDWAPEQQHNVSIRGGSDKIKYYGFVGYLNQQTMIKKNGGKYERFNYQSNIDAKILDNLTLQVNIGYSQEDRNFPTRDMSPGTSNIWQDYWNTLPYYPATLPDPNKISYANGAGTGGLHVSSNRDLTGYSDTRNEDLRASASLEYKFKFVKGLSFKLFESYRKLGVFNKTFSKPVTLYTYDPTSETYTLAGTFGGSKASLNQSVLRDATFTQQYSFNYDNYFKDHHVSAMALLECIDYSSNTLLAGRKNFMSTAIDQMFAGSAEGMTNNGYASEMGRMSVVGRINYSYMDKYLLEAILRADASAKFPPEKRWGYFPSVSLGWVVSKEKFMSDIKFIDNLKLRLSYGQSGNDGVGNFQYLSGYNYGHSYLFGNDAVQGITPTGLANPNLTWEKVEISNVGIDFSFFNRNLYGEMDVFYRERTGIPADRIGSLPSTFGAALPPENLNSLTDRGFEIKLGTSGRWNDLVYDISGNISWSRAKWKYVEEANITDPDQARIYLKSGKWTDCDYGYISEGLFTSQEEIMEAPHYQDLGGNATLRPGDVKYKDLNGDNIINWKDQTEIGKGKTPHWMYGINIALAYKGFDLSALFQGAFGYNQHVTSDMFSTLLYEERWTSVENNPNALFYRLGGAASNNWASDFLYKKAGYLRLKVASLGYNLPKYLIEKCKLSNVRVYLSGTNLLTFNKLGKYGIDPEAPNVGCYYPQQRTISLGLNVSF